MRLHIRLPAQLIALLAMTGSSLAAQRGSAIVPMKEAWHFDSTQSALRAPRALLVAGACQVWVADTIAGLWRFGCGGENPQRVGAVGRSPEAYQQAWQVAAIGMDSVALFDRILQQLHVFSAGGVSGSISEVRWPESMLGQVHGLAFVSGTFRATTYNFPSAADPASLKSLVLSFARGTAARDTVAAFSGRPSIYWGSAFGGSHFDVPNQERPLITLLPDGGFVVAMNDSARAVVYDAGGHVRRAFALTAGVPVPISKADRDAYGDSVRKITDREMLAQHYNEPESKKFRMQIETYLREDVIFPAQRQLQDQIVADVAGASLWVLESGTGKNYARTWDIYSLPDGILQRRVTVPHKGAVIAAVVRDDALYAIELPLSAPPRVVKYVR